MRNTLETFGFFAICAFIACALLMPLPNQQPKPEGPDDFYVIERVTDDGPQWFMRVDVSPSLVPDWRDQWTPEARQATRFGDQASAERYMHVIGGFARPWLEVIK